MLTFDKCIFSATGSRGDLLEHAFALVVVWEKEPRALVGGPVAPGVPGLWQAPAAHIPAQLDPQVNH
jgi:hypothetical protein